MWGGGDYDYLVKAQLVSTPQMKTNFKIELYHITVTMLRHTQLARYYIFLKLLTYKLLYLSYVGIIFFFFSGA